LPRYPRACPPSHRLLRSRRCFPHLSLLRGAGWEAKHWAQLFGLLRIKGATKESLTLRQLLAAGDDIAAAADRIRALNTQAQAEAVIRKALDELDLWGLQRSFTLTTGGKARAHISHARPAACHADHCPPHRASLV